MARRMLVASETGDLSMALTMRRSTSLSVDG